MTTVSAQATQIPVPAGITVLPDPNLGGVLREYREMKRKAAVGELVLVSDSHPADWHRGQVRKVKRITFDGHIGFEGERGGGAFTRQYSVLEPTAIVHIPRVGSAIAQRYEMVERVAQVGERVIVVEIDNNHTPSVYENYHVGDAFTVIEMAAMPNAIYGGGKGHAVFQRNEYRVLVPLTTTSQNATPVAAPAYDINTHIAKFGADVSKSVTDALKIAYDEGYRAGYAQGEHDAALDNANAQGTYEAPSGIALVTPLMQPAKNPQFTRAEIVEMAKADVADMLAKASPCSSKHDFSPETTKCGPLDFKFVENREKRIVIALGTWSHLPLNGKYPVRGIAKCAPDDAFNVDIGKAIALRRALGLEVPREYLSVPQPQQAQVGDVVTFPTVLEYGTLYRVDDAEKGELTIVCDDWSESVGKSAYAGESTENAIIIDDSRDDYVYNNDKWQRAQAKVRDAHGEERAAA